MPFPDRFGITERVPLRFRKPTAEHASAQRLCFNNTLFGKDLIPGTFWELGEMTQPNLSWVNGFFRTAESGKASCGRTRRQLRRERDDHRSRLRIDVGPRGYVPG